MRRTKIIATLGPASHGQEQVDALIAAGVDVFRINFSHGSRDTQRQMWSWIRTGEERAGRPVAIMQDLAGSKIRIGRLRRGKPVVLLPGATFRLATGDFAGDSERVSVHGADLARSVTPGNRLLLDDGRIQLRVVDTDGREVQTEVTHGGTLGEYKGVSAPGVRFVNAGLTEKDIDDLHFGLTCGVDLVAVSFVQSAEDLLRARAVNRKATSPAWLVAKIERPQAVEDIDAILDVADAIMVARGDLGLEIPLEHVPRVQKDLTRRARAHGVPVILATQVLESMRVEPRPTRAEASDAANAVEDGVDAIMLAGETAVGGFPTESVRTLDAIIRDAETMVPPVVPPAPFRGEDGHGRALCTAAVTLAESAKASAIVAVTHAGSTARQLATLRPHMPVYAVTDDAATARRLMLCWGVTSLLIDSATLTHSPVSSSLVATGVLPAGATVVLVRIHDELGLRDANFVSLLRLEPSVGGHAP